MTTAILERRLRPYREPVSNGLLQFLLVNFPARPIQSVSMHKRYSKAIGVILEALENDELSSNAKDAAEEFIRIVAPVVEEFERSHFPIGTATAPELLRFLMDQHHLGQRDLAGDLGGQSVVSDILRGKRKLNVDQIQKLSLRFRVSPSVFFPESK